MEGRDSRARRLPQPLRSLRQLYLWAWFTLRDFVADRGLDVSASLAYVTLLSLVPLLATAAALSRSFFSAHTERIVEMVTVVLPYSSTAVEETLIEFVGRASTLSGIGSLLFLVIVFRLFFAIEANLNAVWGVAARRSAALRIFSFTMVLFWGPVVAGAGSTLLFWLEGQPWAPSSALLLPLAHVALPLVGLTMMYWLVPHTSVHLGAALIGGLTATLGLQTLRTAFLYYLRQFPDINFIFGSLGLAVLFLVSLFAFWMLVILGAEASYVAQNLPALTRGKAATGGAQPDARLTAFALLAECYVSREARGSHLSSDRLAATLGITQRYATGLLERLVDAGLLAVTGHERELFVPVRDASRLNLAEAWSLLHEDSEPGDLEGSSEELLARLRLVLDEARASELEVLSAVTFEDLLAKSAAPESGA